MVAAVGVIGAGVTIGIALFAGLYGLQALVPADRRGVVNGAFMALVTLAGLGLGPVLTGMLSDGSGHAASAVVTDGIGLDQALLVVGAGAAALAALAAFAGGRVYTRAARWAPMAQRGRAA